MSWERRSTPSQNRKRSAEVSRSLYGFQVHPTDRCVNGSDQNH
jgi:hypothetical protein